MGTFRVLSTYGFLLLLLYFWSSESDVVTVDVHVAQDLLSSGHHFLDVRTEEEFKNGHVENALNIPYMYHTPDGWVKNPNLYNKFCPLTARKIKLLWSSSMCITWAEGNNMAWMENGFGVQKPHHEEL